jgi:hypothetical protein
MWDERFDEVATHLGEEAEKLAAIKVHLSRQLLGNYEQINQVLSNNAEVVEDKNLGYIQRCEGRVHVCKFKSGDSFVYIEHETGAEIFFILALIAKGSAAVGSTAYAARQIWLLYLAIRGSVVREAKKINTPVKISGQIRMKKGMKTFQQPQELADASEEDAGQWEDFKNLSEDLEQLET